MPSHGQHRLLRGVCYPQILAGLRKLAEDAGEEPPIKTKAQLHAAMLHKARIKSTSNLTKPQFNALVEWVLAYWSQRGIEVELNS